MLMKSLTFFRIGRSSHKSTQVTPQLFIHFFYLAKFANRVKPHELTIKTLIYKVPPPLVWATLVSSKHKDRER